VLRTPAALGNIPTFILPRKRYPYSRNVMRNTSKKFDFFMNLHGSAALIINFLYVFQKFVAWRGL
jgi:hypothetical protein